MGVNSELTLTERRFRDDQTIGLIAAWHQAASRSETAAGMIPSRHPETQNRSLAHGGSCRPTPSDPY